MLNILNRNGFKIRNYELTKPWKSLEEQKSGGAVISFRFTATKGKGVTAIQNQNHASSYCQPLSFSQLLDGWNGNHSHLDIWEPYSSAHYHFQRTGKNIYAPLFSFTFVIPGIPGKNVWGYKCQQTILMLELLQEVSKPPNSVSLRKEPSNTPLLSLK